MRNNKLVFEVRSSEAFYRFRGMFKGRYLVRSCFKSLEEVPTPIVYPAYLVLEGLRFRLETVGITQSDIVVRSKTLSVKSKDGETVISEGVDCYPKFVRSGWNSFGVVFRFRSIEDYDDFWMQLVGSHATTYQGIHLLDTVGELYAVVKDGIIVPLEATLEGYKPLVSIKERDKLRITGDVVVGYKKGYEFETPIRLM